MSIHFMLCLLGECLRERKVHWSRQGSRLVFLVNFLVPAPRLQLHLACKSKYCCRQLWIRWFAFIFYSFIHLSPHKKLLMEVHPNFFFFFLSFCCSRGFQDFPLNSFPLNSLSALPISCAQPSSNFHTPPFSCGWPLSHFLMAWFSWR